MGIISCRLPDIPGSYIRFGLPGRFDCIYFIWFFYLPGPLFGIIVSLFKDASVLQKFLFFVASCIVYFIALNVLNFDPFSQNGISISRLFLAALISGILLQLCFNCIFITKLNIRESIIRPALIGLGSVILPSLCILVTRYYPAWLPDPYINLGYFLVYPVWYFLFGIHLSSQEVSATTICFRKIKR